MRSQNKFPIAAIIFVVMLLAFVNIFNSIPSFLALMIAAGIAYAFANNMARDRERQLPQQPREWQSRASSPKQPTTSRDHSIAQEVANRAMENANNSPHARGIRLLDIGMLAYDGGKQPKVSRAEAIPASATHLRPYMVIHFPYQQSAQGRITFELIDDNEQVRFVAAQRYEIVPGQNFLTPQNWLPMGDQEPGGNWSLRISIGDQVLALHDFKITPDAGAAFRSYLRPDGEIDEWLAKSAEQSATERMSLDDLIGDQEEIDIDMFRESQAQRQIKERR
jgi:hypothetical protein